MALRKIPAREATRRSELRSLVSRFPGPAIHVREQRLWSNRAAERLTGYGNDEIRTVATWFGALSPEGDARAAYEAAKAEGFSREFTVALARRGGSRRHVEFRACSDDGEEAWFLRDVTDVHTAQRDLRSREQELQVTIDLARLGTWVWDLRTGRLVGDAVARAHYGVSDDPASETYEAYVGRITPSHRARFEDAIGAAIESRSGFDVEFEVRHRDGSRRWLHELGRVIVDEAGEPVKVIGATRDTTAHKHLEAQLINAARMESLGRFSEGIAHDFNNILTIVGGHVEFLQQDSSIPARSAARLDSIHTACNRARELIDQLMELGRPVAALSGVIDLHAELEAMSVALRQMMGESVSVELSLGASRAEVRMERARFHAVVLNLATNARDAMPDGGVLRFSTRDHVAAEAEPQGPGPGRIEIAVVDSGIGMDGATTPHVFEPFFTTKDPGMGTGLGLAVTSSTIVDAGGAISVESEPGVGTRFTITLPLADEPAEAAAETAPTPGPGHEAGLVMVVEDEAEVLEVVADVMRSAGYRVLEALTSQEAIEYVASGAAPDLLLTDVVMPDITGPELADRLTRRLPGLSVLFMSGYAAKVDGGAAIDPDLVIRKPFSHRQLIDRVRHALGSRPSSPVPGC